MTTTSQPAERAALLVEPPAESRLAQLHTAYPAAKAAADAAAAALKVITDGIKLELTRAAPEQPLIELRGAGQPALRLTYVQSWRLDSRTLKAQDPETYVRYARQSGAWRLEVVGQRGVE